MVKRENTLMAMGLDRSKLGQPDERTLYKVQHRGEPADADFFQITVNGNLDDDILQRRIHDVNKLRQLLDQQFYKCREVVMLKLKPMPILLPRLSYGCVPARFIRPCSSADPRAGSAATLGCLVGQRSDAIRRGAVGCGLNDSTVEKWVNTHGRPLGLALGLNNELIVADAYKKFKLTDGVDVADNGVIYFTDASYKYSLHEDIKDIMEDRPHDRFMSFDPVTLKTRVLVGELYFANGVAWTWIDEKFDCRRRCRKYYIKGNKQRKVEKFIDNLPGFPDNIKYDGDGHYWIALAAATSVPLDIAFKYPSIRKAMIVVQKYTERLHMEDNAGVLAVDLEGKPVAHYHDRKLSMIMNGTTIGNRLYCGSVLHPRILSLSLDQYPARATGESK
ncbi:Protein STRICTOSIDINE SYNTHASE-LIKE 5 [Hibiscus syriacus]|uniref:Protein STRICTOSIDINE SYNTHASE-LIKE 5 n=1 Tax=Hibiscus syriacus TaxID=106335 RepID=A0A6A3BIZ5_HIBSY|nr:Protein STRICTOSIDINE SYNTHASE-LIKE 5 [Hibiscus syriacus]